MSVGGPEVSFAMTDPCPHAMTFHHSPDDSSHLVTFWELQKGTRRRHRFGEKTNDGFCVIKVFFFNQIIIFLLFMPFFFLAKEKGPKRKAPLKRRGAAFPRIPSEVRTKAVVLRSVQAVPGYVAGRIRAEKPLPP
ncbi:MAG: hypothetical protein OXU79_00835 [Gemmatimonadota bacterium]|nr:hypothetical protein [Gemmatimonadota bacterium]